MDAKTVSNSNESEDEDVPAGDILVTAVEIEDSSRILGMGATDAYYLKKCGWPIGSTSGKPIAKEPAADASGAKRRGGGHGGKLIASKKRLVRHVERLARGGSAA